MNCPDIRLEDRDVRQRDIVRPEVLASHWAMVIGVGAIGRQVALQLAAIGLPRMTLFDDDLVAVENLAPQGYFTEDLGVHKVHATTALCRRINPDMEVLPVAMRFKRSSTKDLPGGRGCAVFCCVDSIVTRRLIWKELRHRAGLFVDGRMNAEVVRIVTVGQPSIDRYYEETLFDADQAFAGPCTARSTIFAASIAAGLMVGQFTKWLRNLPVDRDLMLNLLSVELTTPEAAPV